MSLVLDRRVELAGQSMLHALVIGVSDYSHVPPQGGAARPGTYGLQKLTAASKTAVELARWLDARRDLLSAPVATIRLCVAPTASDLADAAAKPPAQAAGATRGDVATALHQWRADQEPDDVSLFYFAGHGLQRSRSDMVLLCQDFAAPHDGPLSRAFTLANVWGALGRIATTSTIARTQLYFVDACRERLAALSRHEELNVPDVFPNKMMQAKEDRRAPIFYATTAGALAYADAGVATLFSRALLRCLENEAATLDDDTGDWQITSKGLERALALRFRALAGATSEQECDADYSFHDFVISKLAAPPTCAVRLQVEPDAAVPVTSIRIRNIDEDTDVSVPHPIPTHPFETALPGGYYAFGADITPPTHPYRDCRARARLIDPSRTTPIRLRVLQ